MQSTSQTRGALKKSRHGSTRLKSSVNARTPSQSATVVKTRRESDMQQPCA